MINLPEIINFHGFQEDIPAEKKTYFVPLCHVSKSSMNQLET